MRLCEQYSTGRNNEVWSLRRVPDLDPIIFIGVDTDLSIRTCHRILSVSLHPNGKKIYETELAYNILVGRGAV